MILFAILQCSSSAASLDRNLCYALLPLTLDAEHAARTKLVRLITELEDEGLG